MYMGMYIQEGARVWETYICVRMWVYMSVSSPQTATQVTQWLQLGNRLTQEERTAELYNSTSHVLRVDSSAAIEHATSQEEVLIVLSEPFLFFPGGGTIEGEEGKDR